MKRIIYFYCRFASIFLSFIMIVGCDHNSVIEYRIENKTSLPIKVQSQFVSSIINDTTIREDVILPQAIETINKENILGNIETFDKYRDSISLYSFSIEQNGQLSTKNFKDKNEWRLIRKSQYEATYLLIVDSSFFVKRFSSSYGGRTRK